VNNDVAIRDEKYNSPEYPSWLSEVGRMLYDADLSFRMNCEQYGHDKAWRVALNKEAERLANPNV
jgi:hypothetical protein